MASAPIKSEWMMLLSWKVWLDIHISATLNAFSPANVMCVWFRILSRISLSVSFMKHAQIVVPFVLELASV